MTDVDDVNPALTCKKTLFWESFRIYLANMSGQAEMAVSQSHFGLLCFAHFL